jgi:hypothetical protein
MRSGSLRIPNHREDRKMKTHLLHPRVLTDEHPKPAKGKPAIDLDTRKTYQPEDRIMGVSVQPLVSLPVEVRGGNYLLPFYFLMSQNRMFMVWTIGIIAAFVALLGYFVYSPNEALTYLIYYGEVFAIFLAIGLAHASLKWWWERHKKENGAGTT